MSDHELRIIDAESGEIEPQRENRFSSIWGIVLFIILIAIGLCGLGILGHSIYKQLSVTIEEEPKYLL